MKNLSLGLNAVLIIAVIILYVKVFSGNKNDLAKIKETRTVTGAQAGNASPIAFVELDSLNNKIKYIKEKREELEAEQKNIETEWQNGYRNLESRKNEFLKRGNSITQQEAETFQGELMQQQQQIDGRKQALTQKLSERSYKFMDDIQGKLKDFLKDYNRDKNYQYILTTGTGLDYMLYKDSAYNVTDDVIKGMNEKMTVKK